jgi:hypothetical protein
MVHVHHCSKRQRQHHCPQVTLYGANREQTPQGLLSAISWRCCSWAADRQYSVTVVSWPCAAPARQYQQLQLPWKDARFLTRHSAPKEAGVPPARLAPSAPGLQHELPSQTTLKRTRGDPRVSLRDVRPIGRQRRRLAPGDVDVVLGARQAVLLTVVACIRAVSTTVLPTTETWSR